MTGHSILQIVKGIARVPGDTLSAEAGLDSIDFLDPLGFSVDTYEMKIPALKSSAVYADSPLVDGRTLISGTLGNVIETIRLTLTAGTMVQMSAMLSKLLRFKQDCNNFWDAFGQIEPVYIKHQVNGEPGPRYALLYDIDIAIDSTLTPGDPQRDLTIVIERETYWRGIAPGDNPKKWNCFVDDVPFNSSVANLRGGTRHTALDAAISNRQEFNTVYTFLTKNFVDIPAAKLPGDAPPLLCAAVTPSSGGSGLLENLFVAVSTKPTSMIDREGHTLPLYNSLAGAAGELGIDATFVTDATLGIAHTPVSANKRYVNISFATATDQVRLTWRGNATFAHVDPHILRGRYQLFLRAEQNGGALGNIEVRIQIRGNTGYFYISPTILPKITVATVVQLNSVGVVTLPVSTRGFSGTNGLGVSVADQYSAVGEAGNGLVIELFARRITGVGTLRIYDLIMMPIDEGAVYVVPISGVTGGPESIVLDTTGYYTHGSSELYAAGRLADSGGGNDAEIVAEPRGNIQLTPGVNNRIYFLGDNPTTIGSDPDDTFAVYLNIVPRWQGLRDV